MLRYWAGTIPITYIYAFIYYSSVITKYKKVYICQGCERLYVEKVIRHHTHSLLIYTDGTGYKGGGVSTFGLEMGRMIWNSGHLIRNLQFHIRALLQIVSQLGSYLFWKFTDTGMSPVSLKGLWPGSWARSMESLLSRKFGSFEAECVSCPCWSRQGTFWVLPAMGAAVDTGRRLGLSWLGPGAPRRPRKGLFITSHHRTVELTSCMVSLVIRWGTATRSPPPIKL